MTEDEDCGPKLMDPVKHERTKPFLRYGDFVFPDNEQTNELVSAMITERLREIGF
jgi:hypothetical protein